MVALMAEWATQDRIFMQQSHTGTMNSTAQINREEEPN